MTRLSLFHLAAALLIWGLSPAVADAPVRAQAQQPAPLVVAAPVAAVEARRHMAVTAHPLASRAARRILRAGGSAVDAAIAAQMVLGLVEPQSSGIGGGAFLLHYDARRREVTSWDGRETAPAAAAPDRFLSADGTPGSWPDMVPGGLSVGTPGLVAMLYTAHSRYGRLPWMRLFEDAIALANDGFGVSARLSAMLSGLGADAFSPEARDYFFDRSGEPHPIGHVLRNPDYAATLDLIASQGASGFYSGEMAEAIAGAATGAWVNPGDLSVDDLGGYEAVEREPVCASYRAHRICGMGPPSSGGLTVAMTLGLLEHFDLGEAPTPEAVHLIAEASGSAFADRDFYMADPDFAEVPSGLLDDAYLALRADSISPRETRLPAMPGVPPGSVPPNGGDGTVEGRGTSHISIVDGSGNAVSLTSTVESAFGARTMVGGFLLNNQLTDFSFAPTDESGAGVANRVEAGKRPRSSMAPTLVFDPDGNLTMVVGSPGGSRIVAYVVKAIVARLDWGMDATQIAGLMNVANRNGPTEIEDLPGAQAWLDALEEFGHDVRTAEMTSGINVILLGADRLRGASDPRREGQATGD